MALKSHKINQIVHLQTKLEFFHSILFNISFDDSFGGNINFKNLISTISCLESRLSNSVFSEDLTALQY